jgi:hypothetical protein
MLPAAIAAVALAAAPEGGTAASGRGTVVPEERTYTVMRAVDEIVIDGKADEKTWQLATKDSRFRERQPNLGETPPVETTIRLTYDDFAIYVFVDCNSKPGDVIVRTLRRDNDGIYSDDAVTI